MRVVVKSVKKKLINSEKNDIFLNYIQICILIFTQLSNELIKQFLIFM